MLRRRIRFFFQTKTIPADSNQTRVNISRFGESSPGEKLKSRKETRAAMINRGAGESSKIKMHVFQYVQFIIVVPPPHRPPCVFPFEHGTILHRADFFPFSFCFSFLFCFFYAVDRTYRK